MCVTGSNKSTHVFVILSLSIRPLFFHSFFVFLFFLNPFCGFRAVIWIFLFLISTQVYQHQWRPLRLLPLSFWLIRILTMRPSGWQPWRPADVITTTTTCRFCINKRPAKVARFVSLTAKVTTWRKRSIPLDIWRPAKGGRWPIDYLSPNVKYTHMKCQPIKLIKINANNRLFVLLQVKTWFQNRRAKWRRTRKVIVSFWFTCFISREHLSLTTSHVLLFSYLIRVIPPYLL